MAFKRKVLGKGPGLAQPSVPAAPEAPALVPAPAPKVARCSNFGEALRAAEFAMRPPPPPAAPPREAVGRAPEPARGASFGEALKAASAQGGASPAERKRSLPSSPEVADPAERRRNRYASPDRLDSPAVAVAGAAPGSASASSAAIALFSSPAASSALDRAALVTPSRPRGLKAVQTEKDTQSSSCRPDGATVEAKSHVSEEKLFTVHGGRHVQTRTTVRHKSKEAGADGSVSFVKTRTRQQVVYL